MSTRTKHQWTVTLQRNDGKVVERPVSAYWDPERDDTPEAIGNAGRAEAHMAADKKFDFAVISVARA